MYMGLRLKKIIFIGMLHKMFAEKFNKTYKFKVNKILKNAVTLYKT